MTQPSELGRRDENVHSRLGPVVFPEHPVIAVERLYGLPYSCTTGVVQLHGQSTSIYFLTKPGRDEEYTRWLHNAVLPIDHLVKFSFRGQYAYLADVRSISDAISSRGLKSIGSDLSVLVLDPSETLVSTLSFIQQAGEIALLRRSMPQNSQPAPEARSTRQNAIEIPREYIDPFLFVGLDSHKATKEAIIAAYHPLIMHLTQALDSSSRDSSSREKVNNLLAHVKKSYWFAVKLLSLRSLNLQRFNDTLAKPPEELYEERERGMEAEAQRIHDQRGK